jgi:Transglutaminase-like superfamily
MRTASPVSAAWPAGAQGKQCVLEIARKIARLDRGRRGYLPGAVYWLLASRIEHRFRPTKSILDGLQFRPPVSKPARSNGAGPFDPQGAAWAIAAAARRLPWRSDCLIQAMAAAAWLRRNGHAPRFHLGVARSDDGSMHAHAWLTLNDQVIVGGAAARLDRFVPIVQPSRAGSGEPEFP